MRKIFFILLFTIHFPIAIGTLINAQEVPVTLEQHLENQTNLDQAEPEDESYWQDMERFRKDPLDLNEAGEDELRQLRIITGLQMENLVLYRKLAGRLISLYELQAVPGWDVETIKQLLPFITIGESVGLKKEMANRFRDGDHVILVRVSQVLERSAGYDKTTSGTKWLGSPQRILIRYQYRYKNLLQFGWLADKDAGEQIFKGAQNKGFDFYSFHIYARKLGIIQNLALGDFTVNLGQGLIHWQSLAFKKGGNISDIKRQAVILQPYRSAGEFYFNRGVGITIKKRSSEATGFLSFRKISANIMTDTTGHANFVSSFLYSGYHRSTGENADRNNLGQFSMGGNINSRIHRFRIGMNGIYHQFSLPVKKRAEPYNLYGILGNNWWNSSLDYSFSFRNFHFFGEAALDRNFHKAFLNGLMISVDPAVDLSLLHRTISKEYQAVYGNSVTENAGPTNESGFFAGISMSPASGWKLEAHADLYKFPWLKYGVDAPSHGNDLMVRITHTPDKKLELYSSFRSGSRQENMPDNSTATNFLVTITRNTWRTHWSYRFTPAISCRNRVELIWYDIPGRKQETGFLSFVDIIYKPMLKPYSGTLRMQYFETEGYNSRIYAHEADVLYSFSIPAFFDKGFRYYLNMNYDLARNLGFWVRWAQTIYRGKGSIGSGPDEIKGNSKSEIRFQVRWTF